MWQITMLLAGGRSVNTFVPDNEMFDFTAYELPKLVTEPDVLAFQMVRVDAPLN